MVNQYKIQIASNLEKELKNAKVIGVLDINKLPSHQYQELRKKLRDKAKIRVVKKRILLKVLDKLKMPDKLKEYVKKAIIVGILTTEENSFRLYKIAEKSKSLTFAKEGDIAPQDIIVPAGNTGIPPGPIISEFKSAGIKAKIQGNNIVILEDTILVKEGEAINDQKANILMKLNIKPIPIGLNILAMYEDGIVYDKSILAIDEKEYYGLIVRSAQQAFNLAYNIDYSTPETIKFKIIEAYQKAFNLGYNAEIYAKDIIDKIISKANMQAVSVASKLDDQTKQTLNIKIDDSTTIAQTPQTKKAEEKKEEKKEDNKKSEEEAAAGLSALFG